MKNPYQEFINNYDRNGACKRYESFIKLYMGAASDFVNYYLREQEQPPQSFEGGLHCEFDVTGIEPFYEGLKKELAAHPPFTNTAYLYRGIAIRISKYVALSVGDKYSDKGFISTSLSEEIAKDFMCMDADRSKPPTQYQRILLKITSHSSAIPIFQYATPGTQAQEQEVIFLPNTEFLVKSKANKTMTYKGITFNYILYELEEI